MKFTTNAESTSVTTVTIEESVDSVVRHDVFIGFNGPKSKRVSIHMSWDEWETLVEHVQALRNPPTDLRPEPEHVKFETRK